MNGFAVDTGTASLLTSLASFSIAVWLFVLRSHVPAISAATRVWAVSLILQGAGWLLVAFRATAPVFYTGLPGTVLVMAAATLQLRSFDRLLPGRSSQHLAYGIFVLAASAHLYFGYGFFHGPARACVTAVFGGVIAALCARTLFHIRTAPSIARLLGVSYLLVLGLFIGRFMFYAGRLHQPELDVFSPVSGTHFISIILFLNAILPSIGFVHLCAQLLDRRTEEQKQNISSLSEELSESRSVEASILSHLDAFLYRMQTDEHWSVIYLSEGVENLTGYSAAELLSDKGPAMGRLIHPEDVERVSVHWENCFREGDEFSMEYRILCKDGSVRWISDSARAKAVGARPDKLIHGFAVDITARKSAELEAQLMVSLLKTLMVSIRVMVDARSPQEIYDGIARACIEQGHYPLVWVGVPDHATSRVVVVAGAGFASGYLRDLEIHLNENSPFGRGQTATALRERRIVVLNDNEAESGDAWQARRRSFGLRSAAAVPVFCGGQPVAVFSLYSREKEAFAAARLELLEQLAADISLALNRLNTEKTLVERERLLDFALASTIDAVWDLDCAAGTVVFSRNWEQMLGFEKGGLRNDLHEWEKRIHPDDLGAKSESLSACLQGKAPVYESEHRVRAKNGEYVWIKDRGIVVARDAQGKALRFIGTMKNIDPQRRQAEQALRDAALLDAIFQQAPVGISIIGPDRLPIRFNARIQEMLGFTAAAELPARLAAGTFFMDNGQKYAAGVLPGPLALKVFQEPTAEVYGFQAAESAEIRWISTRAVYLKDFDLVLLISHDISDLKNAELRLRESEIKFRQVFELMPVGVGIFSESGDLLQSNARLRDFSGLADDAFRAGAARKQTYWTPDMQPIAEANLPIVKAVHEKRNIYNEVFGILHGEKMRWFSANVERIEELSLYAGILTEITDIVNARAALVAANAGLEERVAARTRELTEVNAELETFSYSLSHDMKAPLTRIESWANVLLEEYRSTLGEAGQKTIMFLKKEISGMHEMIRAMLALAKVSTADLAPAEIDFSGLAEAEIAQLRDAYPAMNLKFTIEPLLKVWADPALFTILLRNLLDNALKFSSQQETAEIFVGKTIDREGPVFFVRDNGAGFDMQYADRLFGPFQRMHTQKEFPGTGIGLATVQRIVHRHGGRIWVESLKGKGTTFFFTIPQV